MTLKDRSPRRQGEWEAVPHSTRGVSASLRMGRQVGRRPRGRLPAGWPDSPSFHRIPLSHRFAALLRSGEHWRQGSEAELAPGKQLPTTRSKRQLQVEDRQPSPSKSLSVE